jgi:hypothetical protein
MCARPRCGLIVGMTTIKHLTALSLAAAALVPAAAQAMPPAPPIKDGVSCTQHVKQGYKLSQVLRHGLPVKVTCDGPAHFLLSLNFPAMTQQARDVTHLLGHKSLPAIAFSHEISLGKAGTVTSRQRWSRSPAKWPSATAGRRSTCSSPSSARTATCGAMGS